MNSKLHKLGLCLVPVLLYGCGATMLIGEAVRSGKKKVDIVLAPGVTSQTLQEKSGVGINVNPAGQQIVWPSGNAQAGVLSDMLVKEFLRMGYQARTLGEVLTEPISNEKLGELRSLGLDLLLLGNMNVSASTSTGAALTGGDWFNTGVISATVKGIDSETGALLFIISVEYGKAKKAGEVAVDIASSYKDVVTGKIEQSR